MDKKLKAQDKLAKKAERETAKANGETFSMYAEIDWPDDDDDETLSR